MYYKLIRENPLSVNPEIIVPLAGKELNSEKSVRGTLYSVEHRFSRSAGIYKEYLTPIAPTLENADYLIPALIYKVQVTHSPKFGKLMPILCQVPNRSGIRIHRGTKPEHSKGCILIPDKDICEQLTNTLLAEQQAHEETRLEIVQSPL